ncbi:MAG: 2-hydroxyacid dehydrogenase [Chitinophagales bacterium]|nr:MAG: 2-hydroxyacid dehydrogenase [Chitinophagales bacterium]
MPVILVTTSSFSLKNEGLILNPYKRKLTERELITLVEQHQPEALIAGVEPITESVFECAKKLKIIARVGAGLDNVDLHAAQRWGIKVISTPDAVTAPVAELTVGLMLAALRGIALSDRKMRQGVWERPQGRLLQGKQVGIAGAGRIGSATARLCQGFGARIVFFDPFRSSEAYSFSPSLAELAASSDILSLHMPYSADTHHIIDRHLLEVMKPEAILINASRGGLVDEDALVDALSTGRLAAAALDCFEQEPYNGKLLQLDNVILTAHIGSYAREARIKMEQEALHAVLSYFNLDT